MIGRSQPIAANFAPQLFLAMAFASAGAAMAITLFIGDRHLLLYLFGGVLVVVLFLAATDQRLFCLWGLVLTAPLSLAKVFMPFPHMGGAAAYTIDVSDIFLVPMVLYTLHDWLTGRRPPRLSPYVSWSLALIVLGVFDVVFGSMRQISAEEVFRLVKCLLLSLVIFNQCVRRRQIMHLAAALLVGVGLEAIIALLQFATKSNLGMEGLGAPPQLEIDTDEAALGMFRVGGLLIHANVFGAYLALLMPLGLALLFGRVRWYVKLALMGITGLGLVALLLTLSRTSWLSFSVALVTLYFLSFLYPHLRKRYLLQRLAVIACLAVAAILLSGFIERRIASDPGSVEFRWEWMGVAWRMILEKPIFGWGLNTFVYHLPGHTRYGGYDGLNAMFGIGWPIVHDIYLIIWSEQGTIGLIFFLGLNLYLIALLVRNALKKIDENILALNLGCLAGYFVILIDGLSSFFIRVPPGGRVFAMFAGLIVAIDYWNKANERQPVRAPSPSGRPLAAPSAARG